MSSFNTKKLGFSTIDLQRMYDGKYACFMKEISEKTLQEKIANSDGQIVPWRMSGCFELMFDKSPRGIALADWNFDSMWKFAADRARKDMLSLIGSFDRIIEMAPPYMQVESIDGGLRFIPVIESWRLKVEVFPFESKRSYREVLLPEDQVNSAITLNE